MYKVAKLSFFVAVVMALTYGQVWAHSVVVFAWVEGDRAYVEGKFGNGRKTVNAPVEVYDAEENLLLKGVTDENGEFSFKVPRKTEMKVVLLAGMGHRGEWTIPLSDLEVVGSGEVGEAAVSGSKQSRVAGSEPTTAITTTGSSGESSEYVTVAEMQEAIEKALDRKLKPIMKLLVDVKQSGPSVTDILGGIGYIIGLVGVAAYIASRRKKS